MRNGVSMIKKGRKGEHRALWMIKDDVPNAQRHEKRVTPHCR